MSLHETFHSLDGSATPSAFSAASKSNFASWCSENGASIDDKTIFSIFAELGTAFGFQECSVANMYEYFMSILDSRASRMSCSLALLSVHADFIGGDASNYKQWYFAAYYDLDKGFLDKKTIDEKWRHLPKFLQGEPQQRMTYEESESLWGMDHKWRIQMSKLSESDQIYQVALYLLIWGESNNLRFMPECLCFLYKCAIDYWMADGEKSPQPDFDFLDYTVTPIYNFIRDQQFKVVDGKFERRANQDHHQIVGYDDVNLFFWSSHNLEKLTLPDGRSLHSFPIGDRYFQSRNLQWNSFFRKTYLEKRSIIHLIVNFNRIWVIHLSLFWFYVALNAQPIYTRSDRILEENGPAIQTQLAFIGFGGAVACIVCLVGLAGEWLYTPRNSPIKEGLLLRMSLTTLLLASNVAPELFILLFLSWEEYSKVGCIVGGGSLSIALVTMVYLSLTPSSRLFEIMLRRKSAEYMKALLFLSSFATVSSQSKLLSYLLWVCVFTAKLVESYFFLALSMKDPLRALITMDLSRCNGDVWLKQLTCQYSAKVTAALLVTTNFVLFFLDAYLWYIICNCVFSAILSYSQGTSISKPWKSKFGKLPERILTKIYFHGSNDEDSRFAISRIWNCIIISLYKEHLLSIEQANMLVYQREEESSWLDGKRDKAPIFFNYQEDSHSTKLSDFFATNEEASRRISFFARSLSSELPPPTPIDSLPSFTVLAPHYSEKIILSLREILKENKASKISLIEYLKKLHPLEWKTFVKDSKLSSHITSAAIPGTANSAGLNADVDKEVRDISNQIKLDDIPFEFIGFKFAHPEFSMRTRLWASARYQTLFRTISGFNNYERALKVLYYLEYYNDDSEYLADENDLKHELDAFAKRKFRLLVSMQKFQRFDESDSEAVDVLFESFPNLNIAYIEEELKDGVINYYSVLLKTSQEGKQRKRKFRIRLSGNPILGDGKADNQNHAVIFHRGEFIQTIDANQDNYIEECLKVRSVLSEFNVKDLNPSFEYIPGMSNITRKPRIAILGAREYIFSESIGVLGDVTAGKEQTFGTLFARTLSTIDAKLHYGHPDFVNAIFMCTRGGISKAQKGLHLNEDIYAGMNAVCRGGLIKHCDYYQCGKGRDLGFDTVLNFTTKIGAGMGEQTLSREVFLMGTRLPIEKFLSFYYAHAGFHLNNVFIMYSVDLFMIVLTLLGSLNYETVMCLKGNESELPEPHGCFNLLPVLDWVNRFVLSMFICFSISFLPLIIQELTEKGFKRTLKRIGFHFFSLAPLFEVVVCRVYAKALIDNIHFGGAQYVPTGRGFATSRLPFSELYRKYAYVSIYPGSIGLLVCVFASVSMWRPALLWFYLTFVSLSFAPFLFNPHQFAFKEFILDYKTLIRWLFGGSTKKKSGGWTGFKRANRSKYTGLKKNNRAPGPRDPCMGLYSRRNVYLDFGVPLLEATLYFLPYLFITAQTGVEDPVPVNPILRILLLSALPVSLSFALNLILFVFNIAFGRVLLLFNKGAPAVVAGISRVLSVLAILLLIQVNFILHNWDIARSICACISIIKVHSLLQSVSFLLLLSKEYDGGESNIAWWSGKWKYKTFGWHIFTQPAREFIVKTMDLCLFGYDFLLCHLLLFMMTPLTMLPFIDSVHSSLLFWMKPSKIFKSPIFSSREVKARRLAYVKYLVLYLAVFSLIVTTSLTPIFGTYILKLLDQYIPQGFSPLFQPNFQKNNNTGLSFFVPRSADSTLRTDTGEGAAILMRGVRV